jgi:hypothetical protein
LRFPPRLVCPPSIVFGVGHAASCATRGSISSRFRVDPSGFTPSVAMPSESFQSLALHVGQPHNSTVRRPLSVFPASL